MLDPCNTHRSSINRSELDQLIDLKLIVRSEFSTHNLSYLYRYKKMYMQNMVDLINEKIQIVGMSISVCMSGVNVKLIIEIRGNRRGREKQLIYQNTK